MLQKLDNQGFTFTDDGKVIVVDKYGAVKRFTNLSLTTIGTSGPATLIGNVLNIPEYTLAGLGGVPTSRTLTVNGTAYDLSADRSWSVGTVTSVAATAGTGISISGSPITGSGTLNITNTAPDQIVSLTSGTGISVSGTYPNFTITNSSPSPAGAITGSGTTNYLSKWTSSTALGNSLVFDNGTNVGIGTTSPAYKLDVSGDIRSSTGTYLTSATAGTAQGFANNGIGLVTFGVNTSGNALVVNDIDGAKFAFSTGGFNTTFYKHRSTDNLYYRTFVIKGSSATSYGTGFDFYVGTSIAANISSNGNLLVGTTTDAGYKLDINNGALRVLDGGTNPIRLQQSATGSQAITWRLGNTEYGSLDVNTSTGGMVMSSNYQIVINSNGNNNARFGTNGNSAFGTTTLGVHKLEVNGTIGNSATFRQYVIGGGITAALPTYSFYGDANNGWYSPSADVQGWSVGGTDAMRLFSNGNFAIGTTTDAGYKLDVNGTARAKEYLYLLRSDAATTIAALRYTTANTIDIGNTFRVIGTNRWDNTISVTSYIENGYTTKSFVSTPIQNGNFSSFDFSISSAFSPTITTNYNQKMINAPFTINGTGAANFFGVDSRATDNSTSVANNIYAIYADATLGTNTSANRWAGYFVGRGYFSQVLSIGTTSPGGIIAASTRLDVRGTTWFSADAYGQLEIIPTVGNGGETVIRQYTNSPRNGGDLRIRVDASIQGGNLIIATNNNSERMRVNAAGNVLIGTTTDAGFMLDVNGSLISRGTANVGGSASVVTLRGTNAQAGYGITLNGDTWITNSLDVNGRVSAGGSTHSSAIMSATSVSQGFLPPRMTGLQAEAIATPAAGLLVYANNGNGTTITSTGWWGYNGTTWVKLN